MYSALDVSKWFLYYNNIFINEYDADLITNLKLQKLLYYAQGCYLAINDKPLFKESIEAWTHGPVVRDVYNHYKKNQSRGIEYIGDYNGCINSDDEKILKEVYDIFAKYSAWGLRNMTHDERPWKETEKGKEIKQNLIKDYFKENYIA